MFVSLFEKPFLQSKTKLFEGCGRALGIASTRRTYPDHCYYDNVNKWIRKAFDVAITAMENVHGRRIKLDVGRQLFSCEPVRVLFHFFILFTLIN